MARIVAAVIVAFSSTGWAGENFDKALKEINADAKLEKVNQRIDDLEEQVWYQKIDAEDQKVFEPQDKKKGDAIQASPVTYAP